MVPVSDVQTSRQYMTILSGLRDKDVFSYVCFPQAHDTYNSSAWNEWSYKARLAEGWIGKNLYCYLHNRCRSPNSFKNHLRWFVVTIPPRLDVASYSKICGTAVPQSLGLTRCWLCFFSRRAKVCWQKKAAGIWNRQLSWCFSDLSLFPQIGLELKLRCLFLKFMQVRVFDIMGKY